MFRKILLDSKCMSNPIFSKYCHFINNQFSKDLYRNTSTTCTFESKISSDCFLNDQKYSTIPKIPLHQRINTRAHTYILTGPLCPKDAAINSANNIRHYTNATSSMVNQAIMYNTGIFRSISESLPVEYIMEAMRMIHYGIGLPWWATIILGTIFTRTIITLPFTVHQHQVIAKLENLQEDMKEMSKQMDEEIKFARITSAWNPKLASIIYNTSMKKVWKEEVLRQNCHPFKVYAIIILQLPIWLCLSFALRNFCYMLPTYNIFAQQDYLDLTNGGFGWMVDLTASTNSLILPLIFAISSLTLIEVQQFLYKGKETKYTKIYFNGIRIFSICLMLIMMYTPTALTLFWSTNMVYTLMQNFLLVSPKFRRFAQIPKTNSEFEHPYSEMYKRLKEKFWRLTKLH